MLSAAEGTTLAVTTDFFDDNNQVLLPRAGYPKIVLLDQTKDILFDAVGSPDIVVPGRWYGNITVPKLGLTQKTELIVQWRFKAQDGTKYSEKENLIVMPIVEHRSSDVVIMEDDEDFTFVLPIVFDPTRHTGSVKIYQDNTPITHELYLESDLPNSVEINTGVDRTSFSVPIPVLVPMGLQPALESYLMRVRIKQSSKPITFTYKLWCITGTIAKAMSFMEDFLNKARVENVIPELEYTAGDILSYLERGLNMFNRLVNTTAFTGVNMQGMLFDAWLTCSCYYGLSAQLIAEGQLAFDFSGQGVSLNVDRTPQLDSALGRIESDMDNRIVPFKKQLVKQGIISGDGSVGATSMKNPRAFGTLGLANMPTTRINGLSLGAYGRVFRRW